MTILTRDALKTLISCPIGTHVSLFLLTTRSNDEREAYARQLEQLVAHAHAEAMSLGLPTAAAEELLSPFQRLLHDDEIWSRQQASLAAFCARGVLHWYRVGIPLTSRVIVGKRFVLRPLWPLFQSENRCFILALRQQGAELYEATRQDIHALPLAPHSPGSAQPASLPQQLLRHCQRVDRAVNRLLDGERTPLVLACVGFLATIYERVNSYKFLIRGKIPGTPDLWTAEELRDRAWDLVAPLVSHQRHDVVTRYESARASGQSIDDPVEVVRAARAGQIEALFVRNGLGLLGGVHSGESSELTLPSTGIDKVGELLEEAVECTLAYGGDVYELHGDPFRSRETLVAGLPRKPK